MSNPDQGPPPSDDIVLSETPGYRGNTQITLNGVLIAFSIVFVGMRLYARLAMTKRPGIDDILAILTLGTAVALSVMEIRLVEFGSGTHIAYVSMNRLTGFFHALTTQSLLYFWCVCLMRLHIAAFLPNLHKDKRYLIMVYSLAGLTFVSTLIFFCIKITSCRPVSALWLPPFIAGDKCMSDQATDIMMNVHSGLGIAIDIGLVALPVWVIHTKMMFSSRKFRVLLIFTVGIFVIITGIVRLILIRTTPFYIDATYSMTTIGIWTDLEAHIGLWCGCFPTLQPILRAILSSVGASRFLSSLRTSKHGMYHSGSKPHQNGSKAWNNSNAIPLSSHPGTSKARDGDDNSSQEGIILGTAGGFDNDHKAYPNGIVKNTTVNVYFEEVDSPTGSSTGKSDPFAKGGDIK